MGLIGILMCVIFIATAGYRADRIRIWLAPENTMMDTRRCSPFMRSDPEAFWKRHWEQYPEDGIYTRVP